MPSSFLFVACQVGAEKALKEEIAREHPAYHAAFSRPGFVTFKCPEGPLPELRAVFARAYGQSVGKVKSGQIAELLELAKTERDHRAPGRRLRLHVYERDFYEPGEEPKGFEAGFVAKVVESQIRAAAPADLFFPESIAKNGDWVLDVVIVEAETSERPGEWWVGVHPQVPGHSPYPGGAPEIELPAEAPSRAYLKIEEAQLWAGTPMRAGDIAVEIGSAPGGASYSLLKRGLKVVGVDPASMDPKIHLMKGFTHLQTPVAALRREDLPPQIHWLLLDMNVAPNITIHQVERLARLMQDTLLGIFLTVKLNNWEMAAYIPEYLERLRALELVKLRARQLATNRREILVFGLTRKGANRVK